MRLKTISRRDVLERAGAMPAGRASSARATPQAAPAEPVTPIDAA
jgi:hypothetical protein